MKKRLCIWALALALLWTAPPAHMAGGIGTVTITNPYRVNVREGGGLEYPAISSVAPGETFPCLSVAYSGWYEIELPDGRRGFVSNNLTRLDYGAPPAAATVPVYYRTTDGRLLYTDHYRLSPGVNAVYADSRYVPGGYALQSAQPAQVTLANGTVTPAAVLFIYAAGGAAPGPSAPPPASAARVKVEYKDIYGAVLKTEYVNLAPGSRVVAANAAVLPQGYTLVGARDAVVSVSAGLAAVPDTVTFLAVKGQAAPTARPQEATLPVHYQSTGGTWLYTDYVRLQGGYNTVSANDRLVPAGYTLVSARSAQVYVNNSGVASPSALTFLYRQDAQQQATAQVPVYYRSADGQTLASDYVTVKQGNNTIYANDARVPGYTLQSSRAVSVYLSPSGQATPSAAVFTYSMAVSASVQVAYLDETGSLLSSEWVQLSPGTQTLYANAARVPAGYRLAGPGSATVQVDGYGGVTPSRVTFTYRLPAPAPAPTPAPQPDPAPAPGGDYTMPMYDKGSIQGSYDVYTGPGTWYYRVGNAAVARGVCRWYGTEGDWVLMGYQYGAGKYRLGYIEKSGIPDGVSVQELHFMHEPVTLLSAASITDDPVIDPTWLFKIPAGTEVRLLGFLPDNDHWAYIETDYYGETCRGFINRVRIGR